MASYIGLHVFSNIFVSLKCQMGLVPLPNSCSDRMYRPYHVEEKVAVLIALRQIIV